MKILILFVVVLGIIPTSAISIEQEITLNVKNFGAVGNGINNDAPAFRAAFKKASGYDAPVIIQIPNGRYRLLPLPEKNNTKGYNLRLSGVINLTLRGEDNTELLMGSSFAAGFVVNQSKNVLIENISIDFEKLPFTQGTVINADPSTKSFVVKLDEGYPRITDEQMVGKVKHIAYIHLPESGLKDDSVGDQYVYSLKTFSNGNVQIKSGSVKDAFVGKRVVLVARRTQADAVIIKKCVECEFRNVTIYSSPAAAFIVMQSDATVIYNSAVRIKPGTNRLLSTIADGVHSKWNKRGPIITDSWFEGMGDDSVNIGGTYQRIFAQPGSKTIIVETHASLVDKPRDTSVVWRKNGEIEPLGDYTYKIISWNGKPAMKLSYTNILPDFITLEEVNDINECDRIINMNKTGKGSIISNNYFGNHRGRGIMIRGTNAVIEGNHFDHILGPAIVLGHDMINAKEGPNGTGAIIRNNTFTNVRRSNIFVRNSMRSFGNTPQLSIRNIQIIDNHFELYGQPSHHGRGKDGNAIYVDNARDMQIVGNWFGNKHPDADDTVDEIMILETENVVLKNNIFYPDKPVVNRLINLL